MADISQYLQAIMSAVYGEDVRGSIHDAIALINDVGETVLTLGTAVDSPTSPTTGFYQDSVYLNTATGDMWTCTGTGWSLSGNTRGAQGDPGLAATIDVGTVTGGAVASVTNSGTTSAAVFDFVLPKGDKGDTGDGLTAESSHSGTNTTVNIKNATTQQIVDTFDVPDGVPGATGVGIVSIAKTATAGLVDTYTITYTDGTSTTFTVTNGQDGQGAGDMTKQTYDPSNAVADAGGIPAYVSAHGGTTYTGEKGVIVAGTTIKAALVNDTASSLASQTISATQNRQYAVNLDNNSKLSVNVPWENTTYDPATTSTDGLMSAADKVAVNAIANKADKVASATNGNFAGLDSNGNLTDSGSKASDFLSSSTVVPSDLTDLGDVDITSPTDGQVLQYDATSQKWVNGSGGNVPPNGKTAVPTDDIQIWLHCGNIWDQTYTTINQVLADSSTLLALISSPNASDYMARSTTWASTVTANSTAMSMIGANDYCAEALLNNSAWNTAICNSTYFESVLNVKVPTMTDATHPSGIVIGSDNGVPGNECYVVFDSNVSNYWYAPSNQTNTFIGYIFNEPVKVLRIGLNASYSVQKNDIPYKIQASNDGITWVDLGENTFRYADENSTQVTIVNNNSKYTQYRVLFPNVIFSQGVWGFLVKMLQFYGRA